MKEPQVLFVILPLLARQRQAAEQRGAVRPAFEAQPVVRGIQPAQLGHGLFQRVKTSRQAALRETILELVRGEVGLQEVLTGRVPRLLARGVLALRFGLLLRRCLPLSGAKGPHGRVLLGLGLGASRSFHFLSLFPAGMMTRAVQPCVARGKKHLPLPQRTTDQGQRTSQSHFMPREKLTEAGVRYFFEDCTELILIRSRLSRKKLASRSRGGR